MSQSKFSLSWESYRTNLSNGISILQQNGEFVDMTLAADGHHVKVHQMVMALASPYIKELIRSANCQHPVIFLNKISYVTLCAILEYIYTGEVLIAMENLSDLIQAAKELHIKGLAEMHVQAAIHRQPLDINSVADNINSDNKDDEICYFEVTASGPETHTENSNYILGDDGMPGDSESGNTIAEDNYETMVQEEEIIDDPEEKPRIMNANNRNKDASSIIQYTVSNQGSLQMILNRYMYYLKYCNRNNSRQWRCVDYLNTRVKCPAIVFTKDDTVRRRIAVHMHPYHDKKILKKVSSGAVFTVLHQAENEGNIIKRKVSKEKDTDNKEQSID